MHIFILPIIFVNFVNIKQEFLHYVQQKFVFCILQGSRVTTLKCGEMYDMDFVVNFMQNTSVKTF